MKKAILIIAALSILLLTACGNPARTSDGGQTPALEWPGGVEPDSLSPRPLPTETPQPSAFEELLYGIWQNVSELNENFAVEVRGLTEDELNVELYGYFPSLTAYRWEAVTADGVTRVDYSVTYEMGYKIAHAWLSSDASRLDGREQEVFDAAIIAIAETGAAGTLDDYEKELAIHDYIVEHCAYDVDNYIANTVPEDAHTPYGVLINGRAVCGGYSSTFRMFMEMLGIQCDVVTGFANGAEYSGEHAWNRVRFHEQYYLVDITWDDPVSAEGENVLRHTYFNITDEKMGRTHTPSEPYTPECVFTEYNYFHVSNLVVTSQDDFNAKIVEAVANGMAEIALMCDGVAAAELDRAIILEVDEGGYAYAVNEDMNIITVRF
jgi:transglutaminase-like putative cysteine protease